MSHCRTCRRRLAACRCVVSSNSLGIERMNHSQQNQVTTLSPYTMSEAPSVVIMNQQGQDNLLRARDEEFMQAMQNMFTNMEVRDRDRDASLQVIEARLRETEATLRETEARQRETEAILRETVARQDGLYRIVTILEEEKQELRRQLATSASGNEHVNGLESITNSIDNADALRTTLQAGQNAARATTDSNPDSVMRSIWETFKGLSIIQQCLVAAALTAIIGAVGWAAWDWVVPWVWPTILVLVDKVTANAPRLLDQLLAYLSTLFQGEKPCPNCGYTSDVLMNHTETFMTTGYFSAVTYLVPGFTSLLLANLQSNTV